MKASDIKNTGKLIELLDGNHKINMDFNAFESLEETYGDIGTAFSKFNGKIKTGDLKKFICAGLNSMIENEEDHFTPFKVGKLINALKIDEYMLLITELLHASLPEPKEKDEDEEVEGKN
ncbi:MAG TPA: hypothetical protein VIM42_04250 [Clostridium sp.]